MLLMYTVQLSALFAAADSQSYDAWTSEEGLCYDCKARGVPALIRSPHLAINFIRIRRLISAVGQGPSEFKLITRGLS